MDSVTQASLGAAVGHLCWNKELGAKALIAGAVLGTIPDLDIIIYPLLDQVERLYWHRGESHSIFFILFGSIATGFLIQRFGSMNKALSFKKAVVGALLIYATHILIDLCTIYGTQLFAPFSRTGYGFGNFFIIDPIFTSVLLFGIVGAALSKTERGRRYNRIGLLLASFYMVWSFSVQAFADAKFNRSIAFLDTSITRQLTTAAPFTTFLWRHLAETEDGYLLAYWSVFDAADKQIQFQYIPKKADLIEPVRGERTFQAVEWFSKGWWCVIDTSGNSAKVVDMRFTEIPSATHKSYLHWNWPFAWTFILDPQSEIELKAMVPDVEEPMNILRLLVKRIRGDGGWLTPVDGTRISRIQGDAEKKQGLL